MAVNPYTLADRRQERARARVDGPWARLGAWAPAAVAVAAALLLRDSMLRFTSVDEPARALGLVGLCARIGLLLAATTALGSYSHLVRGADRAVLDLHPLVPGPYFRARVRSLLYAELPWLGAGVAFLAPLATWGVPASALVACVVALAGAWAAGVGVGMGVSFGALRIALDPRYVWLLDAVRGNNPRMQAALIWAPGVALGLSGTAVLAGNAGLEAVLLGAPAGFVGMLVPFILAAMGLVSGRAGVVHVERLPAVLGEIDAAYAREERADEGSAVYLDWAVRLAPAGLRRDLLRELRHLWRGQRGWVSGSWAIAVAAGVAGWVRPNGGIPMVPAVPLVGAVVLGAAAVRLGARDPRWLEETLGLDAARLVVARAVAVGLVAQPIVGAALFTSLIRSGAGALPATVTAEVGVGMCALLGAGAGARWRQRGLLPYVPAALAVWAAGLWGAG